jgi:hypothetical protein
MAGLGPANRGMVCEGLDARGGWTKPSIHIVTRRSWAVLDFDSVFRPERLDRQVVTAHEASHCVVVRPHNATVSLSRSAFAMDEVAEQDSRRKNGRTRPCPVNTKWDTGVFYWVQFLQGERVEGAEPSKQRYSDAGTSIVAPMVHCGIVLRCLYGCMGALLP